MRSELFSNLLFNVVLAVQNHVRLQILSQSKLLQTIFIQEGGPSHYAINVKQYLMLTFGSKKFVS